MTRFSKGPHYGSFEPGNSNIQIVEDTTIRNEISHRAEAFFAHPLNRALIVLVMFACIGLATIVLDRTSVPEERRISAAVARPSSAQDQIGCQMELGLKESELTLYHVAAPWQALVMIQKWSMPIGLLNYAQKSTRPGVLPDEIRDSFETYLKQARSLAGSGIPFGSAVIKADAKAFSPAIRDTMKQAAVQAMEKAGFNFCEGWEKGECASQQQSSANWEMLSRMDKSVKKWFTKSISDVENWRHAEKKHAEGLKQEAKEIKEKAKEALESAGKEAKKQYEKAKEAVQESTEKLRKEEHHGRHVSKRHAESTVEKAERQLEKRLRDAEEEYERMTRKAEKEYDSLEKRAEEIMHKAEKESEEIDRKADAKLKRLQQKAADICKTKCKPEEKKPAAVPQTPPPPAEPIPTIPQPANPPATDEPAVAAQPSADVASKWNPSEGAEGGIDADEDDDVPKPLRPKVQPKAPFVQKDLLEDYLDVVKPATKAKVLSDRLEEGSNVGDFAAVKVQKYQKVGGEW